MFFSQLRPVQFSQPKKLSSSRWPKPSDSSPGLNNSPVQNHFPTIFQAFSKHFKSPNRMIGRSKRSVWRSAGFPEALPIPPRFLGKLLPVLPEEQELARVARRWKDGGLSPWKHQKMWILPWFNHDLTMKPWKTMDWTWLNLIEQLGSCVHPKEILVYPLAI